MSDLSIAVHLKLPEKLAGLYQPRRYKVMHGGRGGGKSHGVAQALLDMAARKPLRILCAREIQKSMRDSVHRLLKDYIVSLGLTSFYEVLDTEIRGANGSLFLFAGLQSHTVDSIKSFEGVDLVWIEEAHAISKKSLDTLIPTIRKEGSEIWMTLNPDMETDEVYQRYIATPSDDTWVCAVNWRDNPWFPEVLNQERLKAKRSMLAALRNAGLNTDQVQYLNAHGTSTPLGDANETNAIKLAFGDDAKKLVVNSTKSMTGHLLGGAGGIESVFTVLAIHNQISPPTINIFNQDPECDLDYCANTAREMKIDLAVKNNFGFGGTNGTLVLRRV